VTAEKILSERIQDEGKRLVPSRQFSGDRSSPFSMVGRIVVVKSSRVTYVAIKSFKIVWIRNIRTMQTKTYCVLTRVWCGKGVLAIKMVVV